MLPPVGCELVRYWRVAAWFCFSCCYAQFVCSSSARCLKKTESNLVSWMSYQHNGTGSSLKSGSLVLLCSLRCIIRLQLRLVALYNAFKRLLSQCSGSRLLHSFWLYCGRVELSVEWAHSCVRDVLSALSVFGGCRRLSFWGVFVLLSVLFPESVWAKGFFKKKEV